MTCTYVVLYVDVSPGHTQVFYNIHVTITRTHVYGRLSGL